MSDCACKAGVKLVYSCSGAADVGEVADRAARLLRKQGFAQGSCIAGVGAGLPGYVQSAKGADVNITIDGCPVCCAKKIMESIGITPESYVVTEMGFKKGSTHATAEVVEAVCENIKKGKNNQEKTQTIIPAGGGCG